MLILLSVSVIEICVGVGVASVLIGGLGIHYIRKAKARKKGKGGCCGDCSCCSVFFQRFVKARKKQKGKLISLTNT